MTDLNRARRAAESAAASAAESIARAEEVVRLTSESSAQQPRPRRSPCEWLALCEGA